MVTWADSTACTTGPQLLNQAIGAGNLRPYVQGMSEAGQRLHVAVLSRCQLLESVVGSLYPVYPHNGDQVPFDLIQHPVRTDTQPCGRRRGRTRPEAPDRQLRLPRRG
jgi:hypothetical protein